MTTATIDPEVQADPNTRVIDGRTIERERTRSGAIIWREVKQVLPPTSTPHFDKETGAVWHTSTSGKREMVWQAGLDPAGTVAALDASHGGWLEFDPREADPEHDEYEALLKVSSFFAAKFAAQFKIKAREPLDGLPIGRCMSSLGVRRLGCVDIRGLLARHRKGDWGSIGNIADVTLTEEMRWAPVMFSPAVTNAACVEAGRGLATSVYTFTWEPTRGPEQVKIITMIGECTYVYIPTRDAMA